MGMDKRRISKKYSIKFDKIKNFWYNIIVRNKYYEREV